MVPVGNTGEAFGSGAAAAVGDGGSLGGAGGAGIAVDSVIVGACFAVG